MFGKKDGFPTDFNLRVFKVGNRVVFTSGKALFTWDDLKNSIIPYDDLNKGLNGFESAAQIVNAGSNRYWFIRKNDLALFEIRENVVNQIFNLYLPLFSINMVDGYENLIPLDSKRSLLCLDNGFAIINAGFFQSKESDTTGLVFRDLCMVDPEGNRREMDITDFPLTISHAWNSVSFSFTAINYRYINKLYQYKLLGIENDWSEWTGEGEVTYSRLPKGQYQFQVRTFTATGMPTEPIVLSFKVNAAWYASLVAYIIYFAVLTGIILLSRYLFRRRVIRQHERLQRESEARTAMEKQTAEQEIIQLRNEKLEAEISHKNIQLADSTMAIIRKNELLIEIKDEVGRQKELKGPRSSERNYERLLSLINQNISSDSDWKVFEELFDQAHQNFFKRLKTTYPDLTQSDLKLCAYLRLNLSSKEIAPLLNITFRGVETRRYRLRRRLGLDSDHNLVEFVMQF
jgi:DNA-binding CsgD family transcriptional regulator